MKTVIDEIKKIHWLSKKDYVITALKITAILVVSAFIFTGFNSLVAYLIKLIY